MKNFKKRIMSAIILIGGLLLMFALSGALVGMAMVNQELDNQFM